MNYKKSIWAICILASTSPMTLVKAADNIDQLREESVVLIRSGEVEQGLKQLRNLLAQQPKNQKVIADYIVSAYAQQKLTASDLSYLQNITINFTARNFPVELVTHKLFNEKYIIFILFCIFLIEFKNYFSHKNKEKGYTLVISLMYLGEAILFLMPYENYIVDIMCTLFGIVLILCLILRYKSRKG